MFLTGNQIEYITINVRHYMLLSYVKFSRYKMDMKFDKDSLAVEQKNTWSKNPTYSFKFRNWLFGATNIVKNSGKEKYVYSGYGITFSSTDWWSFDNVTARNVMILDVDKSSSLHAETCKINFLILTLGQIYGN